MENVEIARILEDIADLLELQDANPFRTRAYRNAARTVEAHAAPLRKLVADEADLTELQGIGKAKRSHGRSSSSRGYRVSVRNGCACSGRSWASKR